MICGNLLSQLESEQQKKKKQKEAVSRLTISFDIVNLDAAEKA